MALWKPVPNYEGLYEVSDEGAVRSICGRYGEVLMLHQSIGSKGYRIVSLCKEGNQKTVNVHRLVASVFLPNPKNFPCVNHKDENKENNAVSNLEWCSFYHNNVYGERLTKSAAKRSIPVLCIETGERFVSASSAQRKLGINQSKISACCHGRRKTAGGYHWSFA